MITSHESFPPPRNPNVSIWRYMNFAKFVWMLQKKALYFCRADMLGDPYEGYYPKTTADSEDEYVQRILGSIKNTNPETETALRSGFKNILNHTKTMRQELFLSCWHMNESESQAMWKLYTSHDESICVRSTFNTLANLLPEKCFLGEVRYIDYTRDRVDFGNLLNYIMYKRSSFQHEREARAAVWQSSVLPNGFEVTSEKGIIVPLELKELILEIFVSPESASMMRQVVEQAARDYGIDAPVRQSEANAPPPY